MEPSARLTLPQCGNLLGISVFLRGSAGHIIFFTWARLGKAHFHPTKIKCDGEARIVDSAYQHYDMDCIDHMLCDATRECCDSVLDDSNLARAMWTRTGKTVVPVTLHHEVPSRLRILFVAKRKEFTIDE